MFSLESHHRGDSNEFTQHTIFNIGKKIPLNYPVSAAVRIFQGTEERVRNSRGRREISVRAIEVLLYSNGCLDLSATLLICYLVLVRNVQ